MTITKSTAMGRRVGARSPRLEMKGTANRQMMSTGGRPSMISVSAEGGLSDSKPKSHMKGQSGRGLAPASVGSGGEVGPLGPAMAAITTTTITVSAEKKISFRIESPEKGSPRRSSCSYSAS